LKAIEADRSATADERMLARALRRVIHTPHPEDVPGLKRMSQRGRAQALRRLATVIGHLVHVPSAADKKLIAQLPGPKGTGPLCGDGRHTQSSHWLRAVE
jgi:hypothetical protein